MIRAAVKILVATNIQPVKAEAQELVLDNLVAVAMDRMVGNPVNKEISALVAINKAMVINQVSVAIRVAANHRLITRYNKRRYFRSEPRRINIDAWPFWWP